MSKQVRSAVLSGIGLCLSIGVLLPFVLVIINTMKTSAEISISPIAMPEKAGRFMDNVSGVVNNQNFSYWSSFYSSMFITIVTLILLILFSSMGAWVLCRNEKKRWAIFIFMLMVSAMVIPFQVVMLPLLSSYRALSDFTGISFLQSYGGVIFAYLGFGSSMTMFIIHGFVKVIPYELEEAAAIDGCAHETVFFKIIFPLLRPVQMTVLILNGIWIWNDFLLPSLMLGLNGGIKTLPVAVTAFVGSFMKQWDLILTASFLAMIPVLILFIIAQRYIIAGMVAGAIK